MSAYLQPSLFDAPPAQTVDEALTRIPAHGWDQVGHPDSPWKHYTFRRQNGMERGDDEYAKVAEGELVMWLGQLDARALARQLRPVLKGRSL